MLAHEAWHRVQDSIGLPQAPSTCAHLESEQGRYLLRLEMRALSVAMRSRNRARQRAAEDALRFRAARLALFENAVFEERALDRNEGLAAYTGVVLGAEGNGPRLFKIGRRLYCRQVDLRTWLDTMAERFGQQ